MFLSPYTEWKEGKEDFSIVRLNLMVAPMTKLDGIVRKVNEDKKFVNWKAKEIFPTVFVEPFFLKEFTKFE